MAFSFFEEKVFFIVTVVWLVDNNGKTNRKERGINCRYQKNEKNSTEIRCAIADDGDNDRLL